jgi:hypothetical protein
MSMDYQKCHKLLQFITFIIHFYTNLTQEKSEGKIATTLMLTFVCFKKVSLVYFRVGFGAAGVGAAS